VSTRLVEIIGLADRKENGGDEESKWNFRIFY
jgi:hypothetical protein